MAKAKRKSTRISPKIEAATHYGELGDEDFARQVAIDVVRTEHMLAALSRPKVEIDRAELVDLLHLLAADLYGWMSGFDNDPKWPEKERAAYIAACAHWPENLKPEKPVILRLAA